MSIWLEFSSLLPCRIRWKDRDTEKDMHLCKKDENSPSQDHILTDLASTFTCVVQTLSVHLKISPSTQYVFMYHSPFPINCALHDNFEPEGQVVKLQNDVSSTFLCIFLGFSISAIKLGVRGVVAALLY